MLDRIAAGVRACGFKYVALDAEGYRSGSMNSPAAVVPLAALSSNPLSASPASGERSS